METERFTVADFHSLGIVIKLSKVYKSQLTTSTLITN